MSEKRKLSNEELINLVEASARGEKVPSLCDICSKDCSSPNWAIINCERYESSEFKLKGEENGSS